MSKREIGVRVIISGAQSDEAFIIQYAVSRALTDVQDCLNASICEREVSE